MEVEEHQVTPLNEEKSFDETTVFGIGEDGSITKRRRRKSLGRRVSFAEATSLHIFPRDDEYETPTRGNDGASPHRVGERRSLRLAAKMLDADKENRDSSTAPGSHRTKSRAKRPLAVRAGCSPALKPENWLDPRDSAEAGNDEENSGPVDLRHLSFDQKDSDTDEDNITLDSTTFAMKLLEGKIRNPLPAADQGVWDEPSVVHTHSSSHASKGEGGPDEYLPDIDMSLTRSILQRKPLTVLQVGFVEPGSDMSITEQVPARKRKIMQDIRPDDVLGISIDQGMAVPRTSDNSGSAVNSQDAQNCQEQMQQSVAVPIETQENLLTENGKGIFVPIDMDTTQTLDMSISSLSVSSMGHEDRSITLGIPATETLDMSISSLSVSSIGHGDRSITLGIPSFKDLIREEEEDAREVDSPPKAADARAGHANFTGSQRARDTPNPLPTMRDEVSTGMEGGNGTHSFPDVVSAEVTDTRMIVVDATTEAQEKTHRAAEIADTGMAIAAFTGIQKPEKVHVPQTRNPEESDGRNCERQAGKRTKIVQDSPHELGNLMSPPKTSYPAVDNEWLAQDTDYSLTQGSITVQVPRLSDLLAEDMNSVDSSPLRNCSQRTWVAPPSSLIPTACYGATTVIVSNPDRVDADRDGVISPSSDSSMEIVEGTDYTDIPSVQVVRAHQASIKSSAEKNCEQGSHDRTEVIERADVCSTAQETKKRHGVTSPLQVVQTHENDCEQDTHDARERIDPTLILDTAQEREIEQEVLTSPRQGVRLYHMRTQENADENYSLITEEVVHATQAFSCAQQKENELDNLTTREQKVASPLMETQEKDCGQDSLCRREKVDHIEILSHSCEQEEENEQGNLKISVEEFLQLTEVQFSVDRCSPDEILKDRSLAETHHVGSLSESFHFLCLVKPQLQVLRDACEELFDEVQNKATSVEELEGQLTNSNPAIFFYFQKAPDWEKQRMRKQLEGLQINLRLLAEQNWLHFQRNVEMDFSNTLLEKKNLMLFNVQHVQEVRNTFDEKCRRPLVHLQASLASKIVNKGRTSNSAPEVSEADVALPTKVASERIKDLVERVKNLESSKELKIAKLRKNELVTEDTLRGLKERMELSKNRLVEFGNQVVDNICMGQKNLVREEVALRPYDFAKKMKDKVCLLHQLQDGFQVKSAGKENLDQVVELSYRSLLKRRYVVRKIGNVVNAISSSWALDSKKIDEMFPDFNAVEGFRLALTPTYGGVSKPANLRAWKQTFGQVSALEAAPFTFPTARDGGNPEPADLRASMQTTRILVGHLMELMDEVGKCQRVVNASCGGGVLAVSEFQNESDGKPPQLELKIIDCLLSIKFFIRLDMSCLPLTGYPFGELPAEVEITFCAPTVRHLFKKEPLEAALAGVAPGHQRLKRTYVAVGALLASIRSMRTS